MSIIVHDCPRCGASRTTFDVDASRIIDIEFEWLNTYELFCGCRHCNKSTVFVATDNDQNTAYFIGQRGGVHEISGSVNHLISIHEYVSIRDSITIDPPEHLPGHIRAMFDEGAACKSIQCHNAAAAMFRLCLDATTKELLPKATDQDDKAIKHARKFLHARLEWLFDNGKLPLSLKDLADCVREDGNDGAHDGTLSEKDVEDVCDFTIEILEAVYTAPKRLELARERRNARRGGEG